MVLEVDLTKKQQTPSKKHPKASVEVPKRSLWGRIKNRIKVWQANFAKMPLSHKIIILFFAISISILGGIATVYGFIIFSVTRHEPIDTSYELLRANKLQQNLFTESIPQPPKIKDKKNPINGELFTREEFVKIRQNRVLAVMIENSPDARPQSGLYNADLVYETLAESGITRYMAIFWGHGAKKVGPIRSVRTYFLDWASEYDDPLLMNIGQAGYDEGEAVVVPEADARSYIIKYNIKSFDWNGRQVTWRDKKRAAQGIAWEHVAYSDTQTLWDDAKEMGWTGPPKLTSYKFKKDLKKEKRPFSQEISIRFLNLSAETYKVRWKYDASNNKYKRFLAGNKDIDESVNKQIDANNVIIQYARMRATGDKNGRVVFTTLGSGKAKIFRDGDMVNGTWKKEERTARTKLYNENGKEMKFNRGKIWIAVLPAGQSTVTVD